MSLSKVFLELFSIKPISFPPPLSLSLSLSLSSLYLLQLFLLKDPRWKVIVDFDGSQNAISCIKVIVINDNEWVRNLVSRTRIGVHAFDVNPYLHEFFGLILIN